MTRIGRIHADPIRVIRVLFQPACWCECVDLRRSSMFRKVVFLFILLALVGCRGAAPATTSSEPATLVVATHDSFAISEPVVAAFEAAHNARVQFLTLGDAGAALNKIILSKDAPLADVFFGVDNTFLSRALDAGVFTPYASPLLTQIPDELELDPEHRLLPVDYGFVTLNADAAWFAERNLPLPATLEDLADPTYRGLLVASNPATSSPGLAFLLATVAHFGEDGYLDILAGAAGQRRAGDRRLERGLLRALHRRLRRRGRPPAGGELLHQPAGGRGLRHAMGARNRPAST
jgi:ABC-type thiamine transport system substrate-binding protein